MAYRSGLEIKKALIEALKKNERVLGALEREINTSNAVLNRHINELEYLGIVETKKHKRNPKTGRPYTTVRLSRKN